MATRRDTRSYSSGTTTNFEKVGPDGPPVVSASAWPSANTAMLPRDASTVAALPPGPPLHYREPELIDADSGQALGDLTEQSAASAARHLSIAETVDRAGAHSREQELLDHVFGLNLPVRRYRAW